MTLIFGLTALLAIVVFVLWLGHGHPRWQFRKTLKYIRSLPEHKPLERFRK